ncbi:MAG TPA: DUF1428 domain-containing protein [Burkholderiaceae bacterium]|jgi:uncharacterized protein YbaA (DUF1428 family)|nr:DUF1428 domain-containing protein [Burkholderiaceae bacterium]
MEKYVDGFLLPVARADLDAYRAMATVASKVFREYGALEYYECVGDDMHPPGMRSLLQSAAAKEDEVVVFAWIVYPSKAVRDETMGKICNDPRMKAFADQPMPFDMERMGCGGFKVLVEG